jgi:hypothetical protein
MLTTWAAIGGVAFFLLAVIFFVRKALDKHKEWGLRSVSPIIACVGAGLSFLAIGYHKDLPTGTPPTPAPVALGTNSPVTPAAAPPAVVAGTNAAKTKVVAPKKPAKQPGKKKKVTFKVDDDSDVDATPLDTFDPTTGSEIAHFMKLALVGIFGFCLVCALIWAFIHFNFPQYIARPALSLHTGRARKGKDYYWDRKDAGQGYASEAEAGGGFTLRDVPQALWHAVKDIGLDVILIAGLGLVFYAVDFHRIIALWFTLGYVLLKAAYMFIRELIIIGKNKTLADRMGEMDEEQKIKFLEEKGKTSTEIAWLLEQQRRAAWEKEQKAKKAKGPIRVVIPAKANLDKFIREALEGNGFSRRLKETGRGEWVEYMLTAITGMECSRQLDAVYVVGENGSIFCLLKVERMGEQITWCGLNLGFILESEIQLEDGDVVTGRRSSTGHLRTFENQYQLVSQEEQSQIALAPESERPQLFHLRDLAEHLKNPWHALIGGTNAAARTILPTGLAMNPAGV